MKGRAGLVIVIAVITLCGLSINLLFGKSEEQGQRLESGAVNIVPGRYSTPGLILASTYESISYNYDWNEKIDATVLYKKSGTDTWKEVYPPFYGPGSVPPEEYDPEEYEGAYVYSECEYRGSIVGLENNTLYDVKIELRKDGALIKEETASVETWNENPVITKTIHLKDITEDKEGSVLAIGSDSEEYIKITHDPLDRTKLIEQLTLIKVKGSPDGWIKIDGQGTEINIDTSDETLKALFDATPNNAQNQKLARFLNTLYARPDLGTWSVIGNGIYVKNCEYLILENFKIKGGVTGGVFITDSSNIRVTNSEISEWGLNSAPNRQTWNLYDYITAGNSEVCEGCRYYYVMTTWKAYKHQNGIEIDRSNNITVEKNYIHSPNSAATTWSDLRAGVDKDEYSAHPWGACGITIGAVPNKHSFVIRYNDIIGSPEYPFNDGIGGNTNAGVGGGIARNADIYGNYIAYGSDDGIELDGEGENLRFFENEIAYFWVAVSTIDNSIGPNYIYRNLIHDLEDPQGNLGGVFKSGSGTKHATDPYTQGMNYIFNNTIYVDHVSVVTGVGGTYSDPTTWDKYKFLTTTRNNIFDTAISSNVNRVINNTHAISGSSFDYDMLGSRVPQINDTLRMLIIDTGAGQEANRIKEAGSHGGHATFENAENGMFGMVQGSLGIDRGTVLPNFSDGYIGDQPDVGAIEYGSAANLPGRPIGVRADQKIVNLKAWTKTKLTLTGSDKQYEIIKAKNTEWLTASANGAEIELTANNDGSGKNGAFIIKFADGYSIPILVKVAEGIAEEPLQIASTEYVIEDAQITNILPNTTVTELLANITCNYEMKVYNTDNQEITGDAKIETGYTLKVKDQEWTFVVNQGEDNEEENDDGEEIIDEKPQTQGKLPEGLILGILGGITVIITAIGIIISKKLKRNTQG